MDKINVDMLTANMNFCYNVNNKNSQQGNAINVDTIMNMNNTDKQHNFNIDHIIKMKKKKRNIYSSSIYCVLKFQRYIKIIKRYSI